MLYAKVAVGLAVKGPFDYIVPLGLEKAIMTGMRAWVDFRNLKTLGYVVGLAKKTKIKNLKAIERLIDDSPVLSKNMLSLTKELSDYYCCSWGEAIETALPRGLRNGKLLPGMNNPRLSMPDRSACASGKEDKAVMLIHDLDGLKRWDMYIQEIRSALENNKSVIILVPDIDSIARAKEIIKAGGIECQLAVLYRKQAGDLEEWLKVRNNEANIAVGTRASIFAPFDNLGLVIIDEEQDFVYKQDQAPHYNAREVALMRIDIDDARLILGSRAPSLESFYLAKESKVGYVFIPREKPFPEIKIIDMKNSAYSLKSKKAILSACLQDSIYQALNSKQKILLFLNRKGFATSAFCLSCGALLRCPRCNINLVYHFRDNVFSCHYCNFKMPPPSICPICNSGYIKYSGAGTEKVESELSRVFPGAKIKILDNLKEIVDGADIFVSTELINRGPGDDFGLIGVLSIDNSLNRIDFRSAEKAFALLMSLLRLTDKKFAIQTRLPKHYVFQALLNRDVSIFYNEELRQREQLGFPPYRHIALVKLRGKKESRVKDASSVLFRRLKGCSKNKAIKVISLNSGFPSKLRGNFYWQILIRAKDAKKISAFLKICLRDFSHSGIIVTVDIDPI